MQLQNAEDYDCRIDDITLTRNYRRYFEERNAPFIFLSHTNGETAAILVDNSNTEIIIQPETIARMLHDLKEENFNNFINVLIHEYYGTR